MSDLDPKFEDVLRPHTMLLDRGDALLPDAELRDLGVDSLALIEVLVAVEQTFQVEFPDELLVADTFRTPRSLWTVITGLRGGQ